MAEERNRMNTVSKPAKHPWKTTIYKHVWQPNRCFDRILNDSENEVMVKYVRNLEQALDQLDAKYRIFDDYHVHTIQEIKVRSTGRPPRMSCTLDGVEVAHLLSMEGPRCDSKEPFLNIVWLPFLCRKYTSQSIERKDQ